MEEKYRLAKFYMGITGAWELGEHNRSAGTYGGLRRKAELIPKKDWI